MGRPCYFLETYHDNRFKAAGLNFTFVQDNLSFSVKGTLRGMHFQVNHPQAKLVQAITTAEYPTPAKRPPYSALDCSRIKKYFGIDPKPWQQSLKRTIDRIFSEN